MHAKLNYYHGTKLLLTYYRTQHRYNQLKNARLSNRVVLDHGGEMNVDERSELNYYLELNYYYLELN